MRVLNSYELNAVNGAGRIKNCFGDVGAKIGGGLTGIFIQFAPKIDLPIIGTAAQDLVNTLIIQLVTGVCRNIGESIGGRIESILPFNI